MYRKTTLVVIALALSGCVSAEERAAQLAQQEINECQYLGFQHGTPEFANCRLQVRNRILSIQAAAYQGMMDDLSRQNQANTISNAIRYPAY